jgi:mRNA interferase HigB
MRMGWMAPRLSMERNAVAPIGKPMAFRHIAAEDEHRDVDAVCVRVTRLARAQDLQRVAWCPNLGLSCAMKIVAVSALKRFWARHPDSEQSLKAWYDEAKHAVWTTPRQIKARYASASFVGKNRVVFNIKGNDYRLVVAIAYRFRAVYIKFVGTHAQYDKIDAATVEAP